MKNWIYALASIALLIVPTTLFASSDVTNLGLTSSLIGLTCVVIFCVAYGFVMVEEFIHLPKSKPVIFAAGLIWMLVAYLASQSTIDPQAIRQVLEHNLIEYASLFLFLLVAMTYINAMTERNVFQALRSWLVSQGFSYKQLFWITGWIAFFLSPIADNLTTALLMGAVVMSVGIGNSRFVSVACVNIVVAANAGGAFSPFGDITTLMVWQSGHAEFFDFFVLFLPSVVNFIIPAAIMSLAVPSHRPDPIHETVNLKRGAFVVCGLFLFTIFTAVSFEQFLHLPPFLGMMFGLSYLALYAYYVKRTSPNNHEDIQHFDLFSRVAQAEWDTYDGWGATNANITLGVVSAIIDNIPVMFAILTMEPEMNSFQWLLITLTAGVGGSLLSIGSAAGVALMGQARGVYTFFGHLKWSWAIALGYVASIYTHFLVNG